ncbi:hypothetical protein KUA24_25 [Vibrio phage HNL01]|nr:hypothetical protein KUA24_25 [Vibrio phage HNL01]
MSVITPTELERMWEQKKESSAKRLIPFTLTLEEYTALYKMRSVLRCFYTDMKFDMRDKNSPNYPTLERIKDHGEGSGYEVGNVVFVTSDANKLKNTFIESENSLKGVNQETQNKVRRIKKVCDNPVMIAERLKPYTEIFDNVHRRLQDKLDKITKVENKKKQITAQQKSTQEREVAKSYFQFSSQLAELGVTLEMSMPEYRRKLLVKTCRLTGRELPLDLNERTLYVVDKTAPIVPSNVRTTTKIMQNALDTFTTSANIDAKVMIKMAKEIK